MRQVRGWTVLGAQLGAAALLAAAALAPPLGAESAGAAGLPDVASSEATEQVSAEGELVRIADGPRGEESRLRLADGTFVPLQAAGVAKVAPGAKVRVTVKVPRGQSAAPGRVHPALAQASSTGTALPVTSTTVLAAATTTYTPTAHSVTVAIVTPAGVTGTPATEADVRTQVSQVSQYWSEQSHGGVTFSVAAVSGPMTTTAACSDPFGLWQEVAAKVGFTQGANKHLVLSLPRGAAGCSYGLGTVGSGVNVGGMLYVSDTAWPVLAHELGHNLGLAHASRLTCTSAADANLVSTSTSGCSVSEYGDPWDVMAASPNNNSGSLSTPGAYRLGLLTDADVTTVTSGTAQVSLASVSGLTGRRMIRVVDPATSATYSVEYRVRTGRDYLLYQPMVDAVRVLRESADTPAKTVALDASPTGSSSDFTWGIPVGGTFTSYGGGVQISVVSVDGTTAVVTVTVQAPAPSPTTTTTTAPAPTTTTTSAPSPTTTTTSAPTPTTTTSVPTTTTVSPSVTTTTTTTTSPTATKTRKRR